MGITYMSKIEIKPIRIMSTPVDSGGCGWYRIRQPFEMIQRFTNSDTHVIDQQKDDMVEVSKAMQMANILVTRPGGEIGIKQILSMPEYIGKSWALDIDDNTELISPYSNHYEEYGTKEVKHNGKDLWKDGVGGFSIEKNKKRLADHIWGLKNANLVTVTTNRLKEYASQYNKNVAVLPNCINFENWWKLDLMPNQQLRVGWSGGSSHYEDLYSIREPLNKLMREFQFKFVYFGHGFPGIIDEDNKHLLESHSWVPFEGHSFRSMCMALDIAIIPLDDLKFNQYKSSIKWYEMSAMGVPSVVKNILPYSENITDSNSMRYRTEKEFYDALKTLLLMPDKRLEIGGNAYSYVLANRDAKVWADKWVNAYRETVLN